MTIKLQLASDLHLEFKDIDILNSGSDVLILSGDICVAAGFNYNHSSSARQLGQKFKSFFNRVSDNFEQVFYVPGNHEFYHGDFDTTVDTLRAHVNYSNITILDNEYVDYKGFRFIGTTLWTDALKGDPIAEIQIKRVLNDYRLISRGSRKLWVSDTIQAHKNALQFISDNVIDNTIVIGHHTPSALSIDPRYASDGYINGAYYSELSDFILERPQIRLWTHGHTHASKDYMIGSTRIVGNPRGYNDENINFDMGKILEYN